MVILQYVIRNSLILGVRVSRGEHALPAKGHHANRVVGRVSLGVSGMLTVHQYAPRFALMSVVAQLCEIVLAARPANARPSVLLVGFIAGTVTLLDAVRGV